MRVQKKPKHLPIDSIGHSHNSVFFPGIWWLKLKNGNWTRPKYPVLAPSLAKATPVVMAIPQILLEDNKCAPARAGTVTLYDFRKAGAYFKFLFYRPFRMLHRLATYKDHFVFSRDLEFVYFRISFHHQPLSFNDMQQA